MANPLANTPTGAAFEPKMLEDARKMATFKFAY